MKQIWEKKMSSTKNKITVNQATKRSHTQGLEAKVSPISQKSKVEENKSDN